MTFGEKVQRLRQRAGLSQDALADRLQVSRQAISRWERDETMPEPEKIVVLADLFGVTTDYLLRKQEKEAPRSASGRKSGRDMLERLGYLAKTRGYLLGWGLVAWGVLDLVTLLLMSLGVFGLLSFW